MEKRGLPSLSPEWQNFLLCILLHMTLPLLPLILELWFTHSVSERTMTLSGSMYTIALGVSSRNRALFGLAILMSILLASAFGYVASGGESLFAGRYVPVVAILPVFVLHTGERYNRHVAERRPFLRFDREE